MLFSIHPYLDPGSGSFIIQILIASLLGIGLALRASWGKIKGLFGKKTQPEDEDTDADDEEEQPHGDSFQTGRAALAATAPVAPSKSG